MIDDYRRVICNGCGMDLCAFPDDYEDGGKETYCGHCQWENHTCPDPLASREDGLKPFTVVRDWDSDWYESRCDDIRCTDDPQVFHVWAATGSDACDEADKEAAERLGEEVVGFLSSVAVFKGHAYFAED